MAINEQSDNPPLADVLRAAKELVAASVGRAKDKARIEQLIQQAELDRTYLEELLQRYMLKLPTP